jgi:hypothetical protein
MPGLALPPNLPVTARHYFVWGEVVLAWMPLLCEIGPQGPQGSFRRGNSPGTLAAALATCPMSDCRLPLMSPDTSPPDLLVAARGDVLGTQLTILRRMPFGGELRMGDRQRFLRPLCFLQLYCHTLTSMESTILDAII